MSIAIDIRNAAFDLVSALTVNGSPIAFTRKVPLVTVQPAQLPCLSVFILSEKDAQDGNVTMPQFVNTLELGISLVLLSSDPDFLDGSLDQFADDVKNVLFTNTGFIQLFEYVTACSREYAFPRQGETYCAEIRMRISMIYRTQFEPPAINPLTMVDVLTTPAAGTVVVETQISLTGGG